MSPDLDLEQPFRTDIDYYEGRAEGIATVNGVSVADARRDLARRHGFPSWARLQRHVEALRTGEEPPTPFMLAYRAVENGDQRLLELLDRHPELVRVRGTNGNDLLGMAGDLEIVRLLLERGADPNRGNDYGWTRLHQAGYSNRRDLAQLMLDAGARTDLLARGDGGTPLVAALFWGHREVVDLLGLEPRNLRVAAGLGLPDEIRSLAGTPLAGAHRGFYRPHGGFPAWEPSDDPQEVLDEALVWAAKSGRVEALDVLAELGARVDADPYRGTALTWAAFNGRTGAVLRLLELGADPNARGTFGGPTHGEGVTPLHLAAQNGRGEAVRRCSPGAPTRRSMTRSTAAPRGAGPISADIQPWPRDCGNRGAVRMRVSVGDVRLFFEAFGQEWAFTGSTMERRPALIGLHGGPGLDGTNLRYQLAPLADVAQVVVPDQRGHGRSDRGTPETWNLATWAVDVKNLSDALGIEHPVVLGTFFGGFVAQQYAATYPEHPSGLILLSTGPRWASLEEASRASVNAAGRKPPRSSGAPWNRRASRRQPSGDAYWGPSRP